MGTSTLNLHEAGKAEAPPYFGGVGSRCAEEGASVGVLWVGSQVDMSLGGDQGGSIRIPTAFCGIYGEEQNHPGPCSRPAGPRAWCVWNRRKVATRPGRVRS